MSPEANYAVVSAHLDAETREVRLGRLEVGDSWPFRNATSAASRPAAALVFMNRAMLAAVRAGGVVHRIAIMNKRCHVLPSCRSLYAGPNRVYTELSQRQLLCLRRRRLP